MRDLAKRCLLTAATSFAAVSILSCGGSGGPAAVPPAGAALSVPALQFVVSTDPTAAYAQWTNLGVGIEYNVYASTSSAAFEANSTTRVMTVDSVNSGTLQGLAANTTYYLKVTASRASDSAETAASNVLLVKTASSPLHLRPGVQILKAVDLGLTIVSMAGADIVYSKAANSSTPQIGSYVAGSTASGDAYLRRVMSLTTAGSTVQMSTADANLSDLFDDGQIDYSIATTAEALKSEPSASKRQQRAQADDASDGCKFSVGASAGETLILPSIDASFVPNYHARIDYGILGFEASVDGPYKISVTHTTEVSSAVAYECTKTLRKPALLGSLTIPMPIIFVPVTLDATFNVELEDNISVTGAVSFQTIVSQSGTASASVSAGLLGVVPNASLQPDGSPPITIKLNSPPSAELTGAIDLGVRLYVEPEIFVGAERLKLVEGGYAKLGILAGPQTHVTVSKTPSAATAAGAKLFQVSEASLGFQGHGFATLGIDADIAKLLKIGGSVEFKTSPIEIDLYSRPALSVTLSGGLKNEAATLTQTPNTEALFSENDDTKIVWNGSPDNSVVAQFDRMPKIVFDGTSMGCLVASTTDALFGELGRYYSNPVRVDPTTGAVELNFDKGLISDVTDAGLTLTQDGFTVQVSWSTWNTIYSIASDGSIIASGYFIAVRPSEQATENAFGFANFSVSRSDGRDFSLLGFSAGYSVNGIPSETSLYASTTGHWGDPGFSIAISGPYQTLPGDQMVFSGKLFVSNVSIPPVDTNFERSTAIAPRVQLGNFKVTQPCD